MTESIDGIAARTRRHVSLRLLPYLMLVYLLAYVDRANLSVAKLQMQGELGFDDSVIGFGAGIFFIGYLLLEIPGSLLVERWSARKWIARIMVTWGIIAALSGLIGTRFFGGIPLRLQFYGMRFLLGAAEAGFFPGVIVYLSHWFRAEDRTAAKSWFMATQPIALLVGVPLSRWLMETIHPAGWSGWRWLFIIEGLPSILLGIVTLFYLTDRPEKASWLNEEERHWLTSTLAEEQKDKAQSGKSDWRKVLRNPQVVLLTVVYLLIVAANQGFVFFLPTLVELLKSFNLQARTLITGLPYLCGVAGILFAGWSAHRAQEQRWHTAGPMLLNAASLFLLVFATGNAPLTLLAYALVGLTLQSYLPAFWTLPTRLLGGAAAAFAVGFINSVGNLGGLAGPALFGKLSASTGSFRISLLFLAALTLLAGLLSLLLRKRPQPGPGKLLPTN